MGLWRASVGDPVERSLPLEAAVGIARIPADDVSSVGILATIRSPEMVPVMSTYVPILLSAAVALLAAFTVGLALKPIRAKRQAEWLARARRDFHRQREQLEAKFIDQAAASGKPRGLRWLEVDFDDDVLYARDRRTRLLRALVAIEVRFEAIEGGGMEEVEAVSNVRAATGEFLHESGRWRTEGRVYFNLAPEATVKYLAADLELVAAEPAASRH